MENAEQPQTQTAGSSGKNKRDVAIASSPRPPLDYKLVCYNVLCGAYIEKDYFPRTPYYLLQDQLRRETIVQQLTGAATQQAGGGRHSRPSSAAAASSSSSSSAAAHPLSGSDLVALQEVDSFANFWSPRMSAAGFEGLLKHRTDSAEARADGSAIFWRRDRFQLVEKHEIEYCIYPNKDRKDNVGLGVLCDAERMAKRRMAAR